MPNATLRFKLPEEDHEFGCASHGGDLHSAIRDHDEFLRGQIKYGGISMEEIITEKISAHKRKEYEGVVRCALDYARRKLWEHVKDNDAGSLFQ